MIRSRQLDFNYETKVETEILGPYRFDLIALGNLEQTIDKLFELLRKSHDETLLERYSPYFGTLWPSSRALAEELLAMPLRGKALIELGCGLALPSLLAARMGARVTATDCHPDIPVFLEANRKLNQIQNIAYQELNWSQPEKLEPFLLPLRPGDWVVASDVLYEKEQPALLAKILSTALSRGAEVRVTDPGRPYLQMFCDEMGARGHEAGISTRSILEGSGGREIFVLSF